MYRKGIELKRLLVTATAVVAFLFALTVVGNYCKELLRQAVGHAAQISGAITSSTRFAMLEINPSLVDRITIQGASRYDGVASAGVTAEYSPPPPG